MVIRVAGSIYAVHVPLIIKYQSRLFLVTVNYKLVKVIIAKIISQPLK